MITYFYKITPWYEFRGDDSIS
eukprot:SAG31_NODE_16197_length_719_cov_0.983871_2_plen_21_part_01